MAKRKSGGDLEPDLIPIAKRSKNQDLIVDDFPIVGIGASAGGLEALEQFFSNMQKDSGMAFVVIQHLDPTHVGIMPELLQRMTPMNVIPVNDGIHVKPNCVYVIPPNKSMSILHGNLHLFEPVELRGLRLPIDVFFRALANDRLDKGIGVILSGMGSDGSLGLKAIKEKNGLVVVQDPMTAKFDGMPRSAIGAVIADIIAPASELPGRMTNFFQYIPPIQNKVEFDSRNKNSLEKVILLIREQCGHDFSLYKKNTLLRRIERRKGIHQIERIQSYVRFLQENPIETELLFKELLIGVTSFFRDTAVWEKLKSTVLPQLIEQLPHGSVLRAWVTGCSTGEEAYSLAILFKEVLEKTRDFKNVTLQIFASDLEKESIDIARKGVFLKNIVNDVSPERLDRFFTREGDGYRVNNAIREMIVFAVQNVIKDPPYTRLDFLSCRNMMIYMEPELQKKLISLFKYSLNPGGILVLGSAETLGLNSEGFNDIDNRLKLFERTTLSQIPELIDFPSSFLYKPSARQVLKLPKNVENIQILADQILLQRFSPPSVMVNKQGDIIYITGRTGNYLEPVAGKANWNIYVMAREGLRQALPVAFRKAMQNYDPVKTQYVKVGTNGDSHYIDFVIQKIESPEVIKGMFIVIFTDVPAINDLEKSTKGKKTAARGKMKELEFELQRNKEELQSTREEMQTSQEELKSTNEELQSSNEELQSTNEELTTSKEEMQSLNEELQTLNSELQAKVSDYLEASNDMKNLLNSTEIATLFLDKELNIRRFTDHVIHIIKLRPGDVGRPFTDLVSDLQYPEIATHARDVLKTLISIETSIITNHGMWFDVRIMPYRTFDDRIDGLVITFTDTTVAKKLELELKEINKKLKESN